MSNRVDEREEWHEEPWDGQGRSRQEVEDNEIAGVYLFGWSAVAIVILLAVAGIGYGAWSAAEAVYETIQSYNK